MNAQQMAELLLGSVGILVVAVDPDGPEATPGLVTRQFGGKLTSLPLRYTRRATRKEWLRQREIFYQHGGRYHPKDTSWPLWVLEVAD